MDLKIRNKICFLRKGTSMYCDERFNCKANGVRNNSVEVPLKGTTIVPWLCRLFHEVQ
uniref:Uncharacterized protein n=1 Tax=Chlorobium phaeobacteroides (strain BS1) TaxID=331678 RepID=B3ENJ5_CHLPB